MSDPGFHNTLSDAELRRIRILKFIVISLGILIVLGVIGLAAGFVYRAGKLGEKSTTPMPAGVTETGSSIPADIDLTLPPGASIVETDLGTGEISVRWTSIEGMENIWIVDRTTGRVIQRITVTPQE